MKGKCLESKWSWWQHLPFCSKYALHLLKCRFPMKLQAVNRVRYQSHSLNVRRKQQKQNTEKLVLTLCELTAATGEEM